MQSQKRTACNECRQQKLRCDLTTTADSLCSRCQKLNLECKLEPAFQRSRKRKRTVDLEEELHTLRSRLADAEKTAAYPNAHQKQRAPSEGANAIGQPSAQASRQLTALNGTATRSPEQSTLPGVTTRPHDYELQPPPIALVDGAQARRLDNVELDEGDIEGLFASYFTHYHTFLPIVDSQKQPHKIYESSPILFWSIISVAARRSADHPLLLNQMAQPVMDLLWKSIRTPPHSLGLIQAILLLCTWPFPTSSSAMDQSYTLTSIATSASIQMGLHRPINQHDYAKYRIHLSDDQVTQRIQTWTACNIIAHSVSVGVGLQAPSRLDDCPASRPGAGLSYGTADILQPMLQIERFRQRISNTFTANMTDKLLLRLTEERLPFYSTFAEEFSTLQVNLGGESRYIDLQLIAALLHLHSFFLSDEPSTPGYDDRILSLHSTVAHFVQQELDMDSTESLAQYAPFFIYQVFASACFILLKIVRNDHFSSLIDLPTSTKLFNRAVSAMRKMSVSNNDVPGRVSDVLAYLWNLPEHTIVSGQGQGGLQMQIRSRLSVSVVYDSLWKWRDQFRASAVNNEVGGNAETELEQPFDEDFDSNAFLQFSELPADDLFWDWFR